MEPGEQADGHVTHRDTIDELHRDVAPVFNFLLAVRIPVFLSQVKNQTLLTLPFHRLQTGGLDFWATKTKKQKLAVAAV